ncbi:mitochondrial peptidyl-tRNA hydrolase [Xylaria palmicola]|nr:mitochondrial peptidyl-tRNA hydrolase [Xylaria palmicola]
MSAPRFLVVSLGNQGSYYDCLHSAGHFALSAAQNLLAPSQPPFASERYGKKSCLASSATPYTFVQSPTMMNISGPWVLAAWKEMLLRHHLQPSELGLVLVHDELEAPFGAVKLRNWDASHRGNNGVKSVKKSFDSLRLAPNRWSRISVGIGRPVERTSDVVSEYVLSKMTSYQRKTMNDEAGPKVVRSLLELQDRWQEDHDKSQTKA